MFYRMNERVTASQLCWNLQIQKKKKKGK
ncbi:unnamed protein product [Spirodela intermedia]|uniref:Uncharacterized protein n=1 Tax=Spirodela intermedia TaxID=51605 RepID=A0A7I8KMQ0_SPIIN|nr:unnamed protein product [Spirodela intermedia]